MITRAGTINPVNYPGYPPNEEDVFYIAPKLGSLPAGCKPLINSIILKRSLELIRGEMKMWLNMSRKLRN